MQNQVITVLDTHPVLLNTLEAGYEFNRDFPEGVAEMRRIMDAHSTPLFIIDDIRAITLDLNDLINAANQGSRGDHPLWRHPKALGVYFISADTKIRMAARGMNSPAFGNLAVKVFPTLEEALKDIEQVMAG